MFNFTESAKKSAGCLSLRHRLAALRVFIAGEGQPLINNPTGQKEIPWLEFSRSKWARRGFGLLCWGK